MPSSSESAEAASVPTCPNPAWATASARRLGSDAVKSAIVAPSCTELPVGEAVGAPCDGFRSAEPARSRRSITSFTSAPPGAYLPTKRVISASSLSAVAGVPSVVTDCRWPTTVARSSLIGEFESELSNREHRQQSTRQFGRSRAADLHPLCRCFDHFVEQLETIVDLSVGLPRARNGIAECGLVWRDLGHASKLAQFPNRVGRRASQGESPASRLQLVPLSCNDH